MRRRTLRLADHFAVTCVEVAGDFTAWVPIEMALGSDGFFSIVVEMRRSARWRYQFRVDGDLWINDPGADDYLDAPPTGATSLIYT